MPPKPSVLPGAAADGPHVSPTEPQHDCTFPEVHGAEAAIIAVLIGLAIGLVLVFVDFRAEQTAAKSRPVRAVRTLDFIAAAVRWTSALAGARPLF